MYLYHNPRKIISQHDLYEGEDYDTTNDSHKRITDIDHHHEHKKNINNKKNSKIRRLHSLQLILIIVIGVLLIMTMAMAIPVTRRQLVIYSLSSTSSLFSSLSFSSIRRFRRTAITTITSTLGSNSSSSSRMSAVLSLPLSLSLSSPYLFTTAFTSLGTTTTTTTTTITIRRNFYLGRTSSSYTIPSPFITKTKTTSSSASASSSALQVVIPELSSDEEEEQEQDNMQPPPSFYENHSINNTNKKKNDSSNSKNKDNSKVTEKNNPSAYNSYAGAAAATNNNDDYYNNGGGSGYGRNNSYNDKNTGKDKKEDEEDIMVNPFAFLEESNSEYCDSSTSSSSTDNSDSDSDDSGSDDIFSLDQFSDNNADNSTPPEDGIFTVPGSSSFSSSLPVVVGIEKKEITDNDEQYATKQHQFSPFTSIMESSSSSTTTVPVATVIEQQLTTPTAVAEPFEVEQQGQQQQQQSQQELIPPITDKSIIIPSIDYNSGDNKFHDIIDSFTKELEDIENEIHIMTSTSTTATETSTSIATTKSKLNLNSPKQVSQLLFGRQDMSTNKSTLEGMAGSSNSILAKLILDYRSIKKTLQKYTKQQQQQQVQRDNKNNNDNDATANQDQIQTTTKTATATTTTTDVLLFDTSSFIFRAYFSSPPIHRNPDGMPIGAVMGFCSMINKILLNTMLLNYNSNNKSPSQLQLQQLQLPIVIQCLDSPGKSFRNDIYPDYKANRPPCPMDLIPQFDLINKACKAYGMIQIQSTGYEADDVIASLATKGIIEKDDVHNNHQNYNVKILSGDKDLMQLVTMENSNSNSNIDKSDDDIDDDINDDINDDIGIIQMLDPMTNKLWTYDKVIERWDINTTSQLGDLLALAGDTADNIPGVPGIGPKIAAQLLKEFGTLENLLNNTDQIPQTKRREKLEVNKDKAILSRQLVELKRDLNWSQMQIFYPTDTNPTSTDNNGNNDNNGNGINNGRHHSNNQQPESMVEGTKISELRMEPINVERILAFYEEMNFFKLKKQLLDRIAATTTTTTTTATSSNDNKSFSSSSSSSASSSSSTSYSNIVGGREEEKNKKNKNDIGGTHSTNVDVTAITSRTAQQSLSSNDDTIVSLTSSTSAASSSTKTTPKKTTKRNFWEKYERGIPKPEEYTDVPF